MPLDNVRFVYSRASNGGYNLRKLMGVGKVNLVRTRWRPRRGAVLVNWGCTEIPEALAGVRVLNRPEDVAVAVSKLSTARAFDRAEVPHAAWTQDRATAQEWSDRGDSVLARTLLRASGGRGLEYVPAGEAVPAAQMYHLYVKKMREYMLHVIDGAVVAAREKRVRRGETPDYKIRNHDNGWVYCLEDVVFPVSVGTAALHAVAALRLDFGAVDVGYNTYFKEPCVYEVNTAPGLEGSSLRSYANGLTALLEGL